LAFALHWSLIWLKLHVETRTGLDPEDPAYLEVALAVADLHVQAGDAVAAHAVMQAVHAALQQVCSHPYQALQSGIWVNRIFVAELLPMLIDVMLQTLFCSMGCCAAVESIACC